MNILELEHESMMQSRRDNYPKEPSPLALFREKTWQIKGSSMERYFQDFRSIYISTPEEAVIEASKSPVVIDLLSYPHALRSITNANTPQDRLRVSMALTDQRSFTQKDRDTSFGIFHVMADASYLESTSSRLCGWDELSRYLSGRLVDLITYRPYGGLHYIPTTATWYNHLFHYTWERLKPGKGTALFQLPRDKALKANGIEIDQWLEILEGTGINYSYLPDIEMIQEPFSSYAQLRLTKSDNRLLPELMEI
jgi:hypothetical protein